jgi:elongation factor P
MATVDTSKMRPGTRVEIEGEPFLITQYQHVKPGKGGAFVRLKLKSMISGAVLDRTLRAGETLVQADVSERQMQYLYDEGDGRVFMDQENFEQITIQVDQIEGADLLGTSCEVQVLLHNDKPVGVALPNFVVLEVTETDPPVKGGRLKPAIVETGAQIPVPSFIERGQKIKIDTRERKYVERA